MLRGRPRRSPCRGAALRRFAAGVLLLGSAPLLSLEPAGAQERPFPYVLRDADRVVAPGSVALAGLGLHLNHQVPPLSAAEIGALDRGSVNAVDRWATRNWSPGWQATSDRTRDGLIVASALLSFGPALRGGRWGDVFTLGVIFGETAALTAGVTYLAKSTARRTRPYAYNDALTVAERVAVGGDAGRSSASFISGHASVGFATATLLSTVFADLHGGTPASKLVWAGSLTAATLTAYARVEGGMHFPTDVVAGAAVGAAIGHLVPRLHRADAPPVRLVLAPGYVGLQWQPRR